MKQSPLPEAQTPAAPEPTRNLAVVTALVILGASLWSWFSFSGPFRGLIDLQLRLFGTYWEPVAGGGLCLGAAAVAFVLAGALKRVLPDVSASTASVLVAAVLAASSLAALMQARQLWNTASHMPSLDDPVQVVDLSQLAGAAPPTGHVRLVGAPAHHRTVTLRFHYRTHRHVEAYVPMTDGRWGLEPGEIRLLATHRGTDESTAVGQVPADPQGVLLADGIDTRTVYELRRRGLPVADHPYVLFWPGEDVSADAYIEAALVGLPVLLFWPFAAWDGWRRRRSMREPVPPAAPARPPPPTPASRPASDGIDAPEGRLRLRDVSLSGVACGAAVLAFMALWQWGWMLPDPYALWGCAAAGLLVLSSLALELLEPGRAPTVTPAVAPSPDAAWLYVMRHAPVNGSSYFRVDVDGVRIAVLKANRYTAVALRPGAHVLAVNGRISVASDTVERFEVAPGGVVAYQLHVPFFGRPSLQRVLDVEGARKVMARLKKVEPRSG